MAEDLEARGRGPEAPDGWEAELVLVGPAVTDDPLPGVAARIRAALGLPPLRPGTGDG
jgi:hypothetical protein